MVLHLVERARLLKQMAGALDDDQLLRRPQPAVSHAVQLDDLGIEAADDQQRRRHDLRQGILGQVGSAAGDTTAAAGECGAAAAASAAPAPVLAPK